MLTLKKSIIWFFNVVIIPFVVGIAAIYTYEIFPSIIARHASSIPLIMKQLSQIGISILVGVLVFFITHLLKLLFRFLVKIISWFRVVNGIVKDFPSIKEKIDSI